MNGYGPNRRYLFWRDGAKSSYRRRRRRSVEREIYRAEAPTEVSLAKIADHENLLLAYAKLEREGGSAPGIDGFTFSDFSLTEIAGVLRQVSKAIREQKYQPYPTRLVRVPKGDGRYRELRLGTIADRTVSKAVQEAIAPGLDRGFLPGVYGFRPRLGVWDMLIAMRRTAPYQNRWVIAQDDIRDAFPSVPIDDVMRDYRRHISDGEVLWLIETVLRGDRGQEHTIGIDQGSPIGPITLNLRLHYALDLPLSDAGPGTPPQFRYADNLVYLCWSVSEGHRTLQRARQILQPADFSLKGQDGPPVNLLRQGARTEVLGFRLRAEHGRMELSLGKGAWRNLSRTLDRAHEAPDPASTAREAVRGWLAAYGPAFENVQESAVEGSIRCIAARKGFRELCPGTELTGWLREARGRWLRAMRDAPIGSPRDVDRVGDLRPV